MNNSLFLKYLPAPQALISVAALALGACGGSGSSGTTGDLSIGLTDGPVENATRVVVAFTGAELKPKDGPALAPIVMDANSCDTYDNATGTCSIDLLTLTGTNRRVLFTQNVPAGDYNWVRLLVNAELNVMDSFIEFEDGSMCSLWIPSGSETGLKIVSGVTVAAGGTSDYTLDFDVRKSVTAPPGLSAPALACQQNYILKPAIRIVDTTQVGAIAGTVDPLLLQGDSSCKLDSLGFYDNVAVYVFDNPNDTAVADDIDDEATYPDPVTSASVVWDSDPAVLAYIFEAGYLHAPQNYRLGLTCTTDLDVADIDDYDPMMPDATPFRFVAEKTVDVAVGITSDGSFIAPAP
jgi:hypothetical protein